MERASISKANDYYISKHRYYELKHFCRQYNEWKDALSSVSFAISMRTDKTHSRRNFGSDPTEKLVELRDFYRKRMNLVEEACLATDPCIGRFIFEGVTGGISYDVLRARMDVPCNRQEYYYYLRKFFWILSSSQEKHTLICNEYIN